MTPAAVRALVEHYRRHLSAEDRHLIERHLADAEHLLSVVVGIVRRAVERGGL